MNFLKRSRRFTILCANTTRRLHITRAFQGTMALLNSNSPKEIMQDNHVIVFGSEFSKEISTIPYFRANTSTNPIIPDDDGKSMDGWVD